MPSFVTPGTIASLLSVAGIVSMAVGKPAMAAFLNDPTTAQTVTAVVSGGFSIAAGVLRGIKS